MKQVCHFLLLGLLALGSVSCAGSSPTALWNRLRGGGGATDTGANPYADNSGYSNGAWNQGQPQPANTAQNQYNNAYGQGYQQAYNQGYNYQQAAGGGQSAGQDAYGEQAQVQPYQPDSGPSYSSTTSTTKPKTTPTRPSSSSRSHTVQRGDTLYNISRKYNTSVASLMKANSLSDDRIFVGDTLRIN